MSSSVSPLRKHRRLLLPLCVFLFLTVLFYLAPLTHDDWYYEPGGTLHTLLFSSNPNWYHNLNGRILGNSLEGLTAGHKLFRALVQAVFVYGIWQAAGSLLNLGTTGRLLLLPCMLLVPTGLYAQTYGWGAGFFNYVPELTLLLLCALLIRKRQSGACKHPALCSIAALLCALCAQLHSENVTVVNMLLGVLLLILSAAPLLRNNRTALLCGVGFLLGGILMFSSPAYRQSYYTVAADYVERFFENYKIVSFYTLGYNTIALLLLTGSTVYLLWSRSGTCSRLQKGAVTAALMLLLVYFIGYHQLLGDNLVLRSHAITKCLDFLANAVYVLLIFICVLKLPLSVERKCRTLIPMALAICYAGPLLVVSPIGPRCLYSTWILMLLSGISLTLEVDLPRIPGYVPKGLCAGIMLFFLFITYQNHSVFLQRMDAVAAGMAQHADTIDLRDYAYPEYVWGNNSQTIGVYYYYNEPNDITFAYYPYFDPDE